jgi:hypothetical protein
MSKRKLVGATLPLLFTAVALIAGCGSSTSPMAPVETLGSTAPPSPLPISPAGDEGLGNGNDNSGQPVPMRPMGGPQVSPAGE